jgi:hypothetical protein
MAATRIARIALSREHTGHMQDRGRVRGMTKEET